MVQEPDVGGERIVYECNPGEALVNKKVTFKFTTHGSNNQDLFWGYWRIRL